MDWNCHATFCRVWAIETHFQSIFIMQILDTWVQHPKRMSLISMILILTVYLQCQIGYQGQMFDFYKSPSPVFILFFLSDFYCKVRHKFQSSKQFYLVFSWTISGAHEKVSIQKIKRDSKWKNYQLKIEKDTVTVY